MRPALTTLMIAASLGIGTEIVPGLRGMLPALAQSQTIDLWVSPTKQQKFEDLTQEARAKAKVAVTQFFQQNPASSTVSVRVMGERNGLQAPLLFTTVSRSQWQENPEILNQKEAFDSAKWLLGFIQIEPPQRVAVLDTRLRDEDPNYLGYK